MSGRVSCDAGRTTPLAKKRRESPFTGLWHIVSMSEWEEDYLNEEVQAFIEFEPGDMGQFQFSLVSGNLDSLETQRDGKPAVEWSCEGMAEMDECSGRGWAIVEGDELRGMIFIHGGDHSDFVAKRTKAPKRSRRK
jgi:hypothetical protein